MQDRIMKGFYLVLKMHTMIKEEQYAEMQKVMSFPEEGISFYGLDMEKEDLLYIQKEDNLYVVDIPWKADAKTMIFSGDYDGDGEKEIAVLVDRSLLYIIEKDKEILIKKCPQIDKSDVPRVQEYANKEDVNMSNDLSFWVDGDELFYRFDVYRGKYHGDYKSRLYYHDDGTFEYSQNESDGIFDLGLG